MFDDDPKYQKYEWQIALQENKLNLRVKNVQQCSVSDSGSRCVEYACEYSGAGVTQGSLCTGLRCVRREATQTTTCTDSNICPVYSVPYGGWIAFGKTKDVSTWSGINCTIIG